MSTRLEGGVITAIVEKGVGSDNRYLFFATGAIEEILGNEECFFSIKVKNRLLLKRYNPERKRHQYLVPKWVGEPGQEIRVEVRRLSEEGVLDIIAENLPPYLRLELRSEKGGTLCVEDKVCFPVRVAGLRWSRGNNAVELDLEFNAQWRKKRVSHTLAIASKGYEAELIIRFGSTKGTVSSFKLSQLPNEVIIEYHDFRGKHFSHKVVPEGASTLNR